MAYELPTKTEWDYDTFKEQILQGADLPLPLERMPQKIETGLVGTSLNELVDITERTGLETARVVKRSLEGKLAIQINPIMGTADSVHAHFPAVQITYSNHPQYNTAERAVIKMHTHPKGSPASALDFGDVILPLEEDRAVVATMIGSVQGNLLIIRTLETPEINGGKEFETWVSARNKELSDLFQGFALSGQSNVVAEYSAKLQVSRNICYDYSLAVYTAPRGSTEYTRAHL